MTTFMWPRLTPSFSSKSATRATRRGAHDLIIAATAKATDRTIVSAEHTAFEDLPGVAVRPHP